MTPLLWQAGLRHHRRHPAQLAMVILGIALGVAGVLAMDVAIESARRAFSLSVDSIAGEATHEIVGGPSGVSTELYRELRVDHGLAAIAPIVEVTARVEAMSPVEGEPATEVLQLVGIDPYAEAAFRSWNGGAGQGSWVAELITTPGAVLLGEDTAARLGIEIGDRFTVSVEGRSLDAILIDGLRATSELDERRLSRVVVADIATAQELIGRSGALSRIDVLAGDGVSGVDLDRLRSLLPQSVVLRPTQLRRAALDEMTQAFQLNLRSLSLLAVLVGVFLVHSTMTFSVIQRKTLFGRLRALGADRSQVLVTVLGEAGVIGLVGTAVGIALGVTLGYGLVDVVAASITDLYFALEVTTVTVPWASVAKAFGIGCVATVVAAAVPAWDAASSAPRRTVSRVAQEESAHRRAPRRAILGVLLLVIGAGLLWVPTSSIRVAYLGMLGVALGGASIVPYAVLGFGRITERLGRSWGPVFRMASRGVGAHLSRTGVATAALAIAISMVIGVGIMISSFRGTVVTWLEETLQADVYVTMPALVVRKGSSLTLPSGWIDRVQSDPRVAALQTNRRVDVMSEVGQIRLIAFSAPPPDHTTKKASERAIIDRLETGDALVRVSEPFAFAHGLAVGDTLSIRTDRGAEPFEVIDVFADYASEEGYAVVSRKSYERFWDDREVSAVGLYLEDPAEADAVVDRCRELAGDTTIDAQATAGLRRITLDVFDRTFTITGVIRGIAVLIAAFGVVSALLGLQIERAPEFASMRAIGLLPSEVVRLITVETGLLGLIAGVLAVPLGVVFAAILTVVVNRRSFGWTLDLIVPPEILFEGVGLAVAAALLGAIYPAWRLARLSIAGKLRGE